MVVALRLPLEINVANQNRQSDNILGEVIIEQS